MLASNATAIAWVIFAVVVFGWVTYFFFNLSASRKELGSEVEMAPTRRPYYDDEELEGPRLERMQVLGVLLLVTVVIGLPLYWAFEPSRQAGAVSGQEERFRFWGQELFETTANGGFNCAGCHGGLSAEGNFAPYAVTDVNTGEITAVNWYAPALNTVFYRFSKEEVRFILNYGRPFSPMPAWGSLGGGPMTDQNIETLLVYLESIQLKPEACLNEGDDFVTAADPYVCEGGMVPEATREQIQTAVDKYRAANPGASEGEALFNIDLAFGAYSCARCHTPGWSYGDPGVTAQGAFGWNLTGGATNKHFPNEQDMINFIKIGSKNGAKYGTQSQGSGRMPGFGHVLSDAQIKAIVEYVRSL